MSCNTVLIASRPPIRMSFRLRLQMPSWPHAFLSAPLVSKSNVGCSAIKAFGCRDDSYVFLRPQGTVKRSIFSIASSVSRRITPTTPPQAEQLIKYTSLFETTPSWRSNSVTLISKCSRPTA